ncbi:hypothetical protein J2T07_000437 [Luteibacter jiangsuensis]|uniref:Aldehyde dehydrogenase family protein n=1 Tax=Luteibacter jiangsuensis TaxID=637577 RepID=A0ABT9STE9_9GAMM|nr:hypothetical protein [Luteibacter jiangsuensis]MDQ0008278.1 hypothetical protein [Luteibacter jiangsuensis]
MNAPLEPGEWMMGGTHDGVANEVIGMSEAEVAQMAVEAYEYAWTKWQSGAPGRVKQERIVVELVRELEHLIRDRLELFDEE